MTSPVVATGAPGATRARTARRRPRVSPRVRSRVQEAAVVAVLLALPQLLVLLGYYRGDISPQFDFLGSYSTEAFAWWRDGSFFDPQQWMPYTWGGYPSATALQSSAWYLPVGLASAVTDYSVRVAAAVQALHVVLGALGMYVLARRMRLGRVAASLGLVAWSFAPGFFANAQHVDIVRGYAWAPWVLLLLSPAWPWRRWWSVPVATLLLWQVLVGIYPGMVVAFVYVGLVWVVAHQIWSRPRVTAYLLPLAVTVLLAVLLACLKFLPALSVRESVEPAGPDASVFGLGILGTVFFPYDGSNLPTDMSLRSYFLPAAVVALLALVPWRDRGTRAPLLTAVACLLVSLPSWPWFRLLGDLPGFDLSRFRFSDYRPILLACVVLLALRGLADTLRRDAAARRDGTVATLSWRRWPALVVLLAVLAFAAAVGQVTGFTAPRWSTPWTILLASAVVVAGLAAVGSPRWRVAVPDGRVLAAVLVALTLVSGTDWAFSTTRPWRAERAVAEAETWGTTSDVLIARRAEPAAVAQSAVIPAAQRPARTPLTDDPVPVVEYQKRWNTSYYTGIASVGGYSNLKGNAAFEEAMAAFQDPRTTVDARALYAAPGIVVATDGGLPTADEVEACATTGACGRDLAVQPVGYRPGELTYRVSGSGGTVLLNEAYYRGWEARACPDDGACADVPLQRGPAGVVEAELPAGPSTLTLRYVTPGLELSWALFWAGLG
ncbi:MAG: hypothetical protein ABW025_10375, partial [Cellulomonas sp.]